MGEGVRAVEHRHKHAEGCLPTYLVPQHQLPNQLKAAIIAKLPSHV
jgi:predicted metal-binding protein